MLQELPIDTVHPGSHQPRKTFDADRLAELADSIRQHGLLMPILVRPNASGWEIVHGERRLRACRAAGLTTVRAEVRDLDDESSFLLAVTENIQRNDLNPIEEAEALLVLIQRFGYSQEKAGKIVGKSQEWASQRLSLLRLPTEVRNEVIARAITPTVASRLAAIDDTRKQSQLAREAASGNLRKRDLEKAVKRWKEARKSPPPEEVPTVIEVRPGVPADFLNQIVTGDARTLAAQLPDNSVTVCFCDPVYSRIEDYEWLARECERVLIPGGSLVVQCGNLRRFDCEVAMRRSALQWVDLLAEVYPYALCPLYPIRVQVGWKPYLWFSKGPRLGEWVMNRVHAGGKHYAEESKDLHPWGDSEQFAAGLLGKLCGSDAFVWDPFTGSGTVPLVCKRLGIPYVAFEIDAETATLARERLAGTRRETPAQTALWEEVA